MPSCSHYVKSQNAKVHDVILRMISSLSGCIILCRLSCWLRWRLGMVFRKWLVRCADKSQVIRLDLAVGIFLKDLILKKNTPKIELCHLFCQKLIKKNKAFQCHVFPTSKSEEKRYNVMYIFYFRYRVLNVFNLNFVPSNVLLFSKKLWFKNK